MTGNIYAELLHELETKHQAVMLARIEAENADLKKEIIKADLSGSFAEDTADQFLLLEAKRVLETGLPKITKGKENEGILLEPFYPDSRLIILGGGHIARPLADFGSKAGFSVTVMDDRPYFADIARFPEASEVICDGFENCAERLNINAFDYVVIVTRGHRHDAVCLRQLLGTGTAYTGMIGSRRRVNAMKEQLACEGL